MRKQIYMAIIARLKEISQIKYIDLWNNNIEMLTSGAVWPRPAVFIEFETVEWKQQQRGARRGDFAIRLHIVTDAVTYNGSDDQRQNAALEYLDLIDEINKSMQGLRGENFAGFMLTTSATNHDHAELIENVERYITSVQDITAMPPINIAPISNIKLNT